MWLVTNGLRMRPAWKDLCSLIFSLAVVAWEGVFDAVRRPGHQSGGLQALSWAGAQGTSLAGTAHLRGGPDLKPTVASRRTPSQDGVLAKGSPRLSPQSESHGSWAGTAVPGLMEQPWHPVCRDGALMWAEMAL